MIFTGLLKKIKSKLLPTKFYTRDIVEKKYKDNIGRFTYGNPKIINWNDGGKLYIGNFSSIAGGVTIFLGGHHQYGWITTYPFSAKKNIWPVARLIGKPSFSKGDVVIGNDVLLGHESLIMSGVKIGDGAIVGARALVTKDVPPYAIVAGVPARIIRYRFDTKVINKLLNIKWWNWTEKKIHNEVGMLSSDQVKQFINKYSK